MQLFLQKYYSTLNSFFNTNRSKNYIGRQFLSTASVIISPPSILSRFLNGKFSKTLLYACVFWLKYSLVKSAITFFNICLNLDFCSSSKVVTESIIDYSHIFGNIFKRVKEKFKLFIRNIINKFIYIIAYKITRSVILFFCFKAVAFHLPR